GNVIPDDELARLHRRCRQAGVPLIIDGAYGTPFPEILFTDVQPLWDRDIIVCLSLSKLGLPAARCGIVVADAAIISALAAANTISCLATGSIGAGMAEPLVRSGEILRLSRDIIRPFYRARCQAALQQLQAELAGLPTRIHVPEGALFLWLWCPDLPISSQELYQRLKRRQVLVVPGEHFFPGLPDDGWRHRQECLRISYAMDPHQVQEGLAIIAQEVRAAYG
ncbi:MAG: aminotransferase class I/II-fold pyridoxal phosphate-dependent enzyme, partial [Planctomycetota bacterium]